SPSCEGADCTVHRYRNNLEERTASREVGQRFWPERDAPQRRDQKLAWGRSTGRPVGKLREPNDASGEAKRTERGSSCAIRFEPASVGAVVVMTAETASYADQINNRTNTHAACWFVARMGSSR